LKAKDDVPADTIAIIAKRLPVEKRMLGHALGAAGALELVATLMSVRNAIVPPTINYLGPDPTCDLDYVPNEARPLSVNAALSNSFDLGSPNALLSVTNLHPDAT
jgi:nodulation protein E